MRARAAAAGLGAGAGVGRPLGEAHRALGEVLATEHDSQRRAWQQRAASDDRTGT